jgi:hypothetical protein
MTRRTFSDLLMGAVLLLTNGQTYYFVVTAYNSKGESQISNEMSAVPER